MHYKQTTATIYNYYQKMDGTIDIRSSCFMSITTPAQYFTLNYVI